MFLHIRVKLVYVSQDYNLEILLSQLHHISDKVIKIQVKEASWVTGQNISQENLNTLIVSRFITYI